MVYAGGMISFNRAWLVGFTVMLYPSLMLRNTSPAVLSFKSEVCRLSVTGNLEKFKDSFIVSESILPRCYKVRRRGSGSTF